MTDRETVVLLLALKVNGRLRYRTVQNAVGGEPWNVLNNLRVGGALSHMGYDHWQITEKGRLAAALAMAKNKTLADAFNAGAAA